MKWKYVPIEDVFTCIKNGASIKQEEGLGGVPITRIETISDGYLNKSKLGYANIGKNEYLDFYLKGGDILMSHINSWKHLGKTALIDNDKDIIHGMNLLLMRPDKKVLLPSYANYYFSTDAFKAQLHKISNQSVNQSSFAVTKFKKLFIPLPPLHIQEQIADTLDKADALRRKDQELLTKYDELAQAIFYDMFGDPVKNERGWNKYPLKQLGKVTTGNTPPRDNAENYGDFIEWIKSDNITHEYDYPQPSKEFLSEQGKSLGRTIHAGSILVTCIAGSPVTIGNCVITDRSITLNQQINAFTPTKGQDELFVFRLFRESKKLIQNSTTSGMKRIITKGEFEKLEFIDPPINLQKDFGRKDKILSKSRSIHLESLKKSKLVFDSQSKLFFQS